MAHSEEPAIPTALDTALSLRLREELLARTRPERIPHVMGVECMSLLLAERWGADRSTVQIAALLHDLAKPLSHDDQRALMERGTAVQPTAEDFDHPAIWHGFAAAQEARETHGVTERAILEAVAYHSTGNPGLEDVGLVLYVADFIEPHRKWKGVEAFRIKTLGIDDLREAARNVASAKLAHLSARGRKAHSRTLAMLEWLGGPP